MLYTINFTDRLIAYRRRWRRIRILAGCLLFFVLVLLLSYCYRPENATEYALVKRFGNVYAEVYTQICVLKVVSEVFEECRPLTRGHNQSLSGLLCAVAPSGIGSPQKIDLSVDSSGVWKVSVRYVTNTAVGAALFSNSVSQCMSADDNLEFSGFDTTSDCFHAKGCFHAIPTNLALPRCLISNGEWVHETLGNEHEKYIRERFQEREKGSYDRFSDIAMMICNGSSLNEQEKKDLKTHAMAIIDPMRFIEKARASASEQVALDQLIILEKQWRRMVGRRLDFSRREERDLKDRIEKFSRLELQLNLDRTKSLLIAVQARLDAVQSCRNSAMQSNKLMEQTQREFDRMKKWSGLNSGSMKFEFDRNAGSEHSMYRDGAYWLVKVGETESEPISWTAFTNFHDRIINSTNLYQTMALDNLTVEFEQDEWWVRSAVIEGLIPLFDQDRLVDLHSDLEHIKQKQRIYSEGGRGGF